MRRRELLGAAAVTLAAACAPGGGSAEPSGPAPAGMPSSPLAAHPASGRWPQQIERALANTREAYRVAVKNEPTLRWIPCYCGCVAQGHRDNFACYVSEVRPNGWVVLDTHALN